MKPYKTLLFIISVFAIMAATWFTFPENGISIGSTTLRFPTYAEARMTKPVEVDIDSVLKNVEDSYNLSGEKIDSLEFFKTYITKNPNRITLPNDDYTYFDKLFKDFEQSSKDSTVCRVLHYGDSQIELDRISSVLRQTLQDLFGGSGPNMIPAVQRIPSISVVQRASGGLSQYNVYGDSTTKRVSHRRYGVMTQMSQASGESNINFNITSHSHSFERVKDITHVAILVGHNSEGFSASLTCDNTFIGKQTLKADNGLNLIQWKLPNKVKRGTIKTNGSAEIYAVLLDGYNGIAVDNVPLRGCSGTIFTRIDETVMKESFKLLNTKMIILQFGGNRMPSISSVNNIPKYMEELEKQIDYFQRVAPNATLLFIGPADMGRSYNGKITTWKNLPALNDSLKNMALGKGVAYWDMFRVMGGEGSMAQWVKHNPPLAGPDYIHFTHTGAQKIGDALTKSITTYYNFYKQREEMPAADVEKFMKQDKDEIKSGSNHHYNKYYYGQ